MRRLRTGERRQLGPGQGRTDDDHASPGDRRRGTIPMTGLLILILLLIAAGCSHGVRIMLPPAAPVDGMGAFAVSPFTNVSVDPGLALDLPEAIAARLDDSQYYLGMQGPDGVRTALAGLNISIEQLHAADAAQALGQSTGVDGLITGEARRYLEDIGLSTPTCRGCDVDQDANEWTVQNVTRVEVELRGRLVRTDTGQTVWSRSAQGNAQTVRTIELGWHEPEVPHEVLIPDPDLRDLAATRRQAIHNAVRDFTRELLPQSAWIAEEKIDWLLTVEGVESSLAEPTLAPGDELQARLDVTMEGQGRARTGQRLRIVWELADPGGDIRNVGVGETGRSMHIPIPADGRAGTWTLRARHGQWIVAEEAVQVE